MRINLIIVGQQKEDRMNTNAKKIKELFDANLCRSGNVFESKSELRKLKEIVAAIPLGERPEVVQDLKSEMEHSLRDPDIAIAICMIGNEAAVAIPGIFKMLEGYTHTPAYFAAVCDALCLRKESLAAIVTDAVMLFDKISSELPREYSCYTNENARYSIAVVVPCALVRLLGACGASAKGAIPALKKYKWFVAGKRFIQSSMFVIDLDAGQTTPPPSPVGQIREAIKAIQGPGLLDRLGSLFGAKK